MKLKFTINKQEIEGCVVDTLASDSIKYLIAEFEFSEEWVELAKTAVFYRDKEHIYNVVLVDDVCVVPAEVLETEGRVYVGVFGNGDDDLRITTTITSLQLQEGSWLVGGQPEPPTPDVYEQIMAALARKLETVAHDETLTGSGTADDPLHAEGGGGGTSNFDLLTNRPKYAGAEMTHETDIPEVPDVSGKLDKDDSETTYDQLYGKTSDGQQTMYDTDQAGATANTIVRRGEDSTIKTGDPIQDEDAVNLKTAEGMVVDNLTSEETKRPLSAKQGKILKAAIDAVDVGHFAGPYATIEDIPTPYDTNDLYLVGDDAPYAIYVYLQDEDELIQIGSSDVDLSDYYNKQDVDSLLETKADADALDDEVTRAEQAEGDLQDYVDSAVAGHNTAIDAHQDIRDLIGDIGTALNAINGEEV
jgi:hypothetical protein